MTGWKNLHVLNSGACWLYTLLLLQYIQYPVDGFVRPAGGLLCEGVRGELTDLAVHSLKARLAAADVLIENVSSSGGSEHFTGSIVLTRVGTTGA